VIRYRLGAAPAARRARNSAAVAAVASLAPIVLTLVLLGKLGWQPTGPASVVLWVLSALVAVLVVVRAAVAYGAARRRLGALVVTLDGDHIRMEAARNACTIERARVARVVEVAGALGGLRVESEPDPRTGVVSVVRVPRGGDAFGDVRARLEAWRPLERRGRRGPAVRLALGAIVVVGIFFVPFLLDDFVARSKLVAAGLVVAMWLVMRVVIRRG
jgi:hypothetical protein